MDPNAHSVLLVLTVEHFQFHFSSLSFGRSYIAVLLHCAMGGKEKGTGAQPRTKDNLKPSSSEKAAQFLIQQTGGLGLPSTLSTTDLFGTVPLQYGEQTESIAPTKVPGLVPVPQDPDASALEPRLLSTLKRLEKRDSVTKQKALKELIELLGSTVSGDVSSLDTSSVIAILPFWPRIYCRLAVDENRKVRELIQSAMGRVADRVGRELGPYIKQIFPIWAFSTVDVHEPAASLASQGYEDTFSRLKRLDAYRACARQILDLIETKVSEEFGSSSMVSQTPVNTKKTGGLKEKRTTESTSPDVLADLDVDDHCTLQMAACIRFIASIVEYFSNLPVDSPHLVRLRKYLSPVNLWTVVSRHICQHVSRHTTADGRCRVGYSPAVHSTIYRLATALCTQPSWAAWMAETEEGRELAAYLCTSTIARLGPVDRKVKLLTNDTPCPIPAPLTVIAPGFSCYAQAWEASLACLTYLPASLIWSVIDWRVDVCLPLKQLLQDVAMGYSKQVYPNLVCLLSRLPLDYQNLSLEDSHLLEDLFVGAALKGLERVLTPRSGIMDSVSVSVLGSTFKTNPIVSIDPSLSTTIVTGLLVCCRFLIDRLTTESESKNIPGPLCLRLVNQVVLRLFADALHVVRPDNLEHTYLVCTQPPLARQDFLQAVFCQMSSLFANLARAPEPSAKLTLFFHIRDELLRWVSEIPKSVISDSSSSSDHPEGLSMHTHLGLLDSLRLTQFVNCLANVVSNYNSSNARVGKSGRITSPQQQNVSWNGSTAKITATQDTWFINLLVQICKQIEAQSSSTSLDPLIETSFCVSYLSLSSYLPEDVPIQLLDAEQKLFFQILPTLSDDLLPLFLTDSTVCGLVRSWSLSTDYSKPIICRPPALSRHRFLTAILPTLIRVLPPDTNLCPRVCDLCLNWTVEWIQNVLTDSTDSDPLPLTDLAALLSLVYSTAATQNHSIVVNLRNSLLSVVLCHLSRQLPPSDLPDLSELPAPLLRNMAVLCFMTLKEICPSGKMLEHEKEIVSQVKELLVLLLRLVLVLYVVHHFACVASVVDPSCELAAMLVSVSSTPVHPSDTTDCSPAIHSLYGLSLSTLLSQIEQLFISSSSLINSLSPEDSIPLILHTVIHTAYVPMQMIQFIELFVRQSAIHSVSDTNLVLTGLWLSTITDAMVAVIDAVVECEPFTWHDSCPPPRPILFPAGLIPLTVLPPLGRLFRVWQLGSRLQITSSSLGSIDSDQWIRYTYCLGVLRGCLASLAEPFDPCVTFGWPSPFNSQETPKDTHGQQYIDSFTDGHLEPAWSAFGQWESTVAAQLGLCWHNATSQSPLSTFIDLLSLSTVYRHFPQLTDTQISILCSIFSSVCLNRIRSVHPNYWPRDFQLTASCTDDPLRPEFSWLDDHIRTRSDRTHDVAHFSRICELEMPAGIVQRCLPRQELLGRLKCLTMIDTAVDKATKDIFEEPPEAHRVLQLLASLISVHSVSPLYATTFLSVITVDYQKWLTQLADSTDADGLVSSTGNDSGLRATLGAMGFIESLLLLWQPWQWYMDTVGKSEIMHNLGLIQLSMRLKQLRPVLTRNEWDLILCLIISWVCLVIEQTDNHKRQQGENRVDVLATRAFRAAAALGAVFIERMPDPVSLDALIISSAQTLKSTSSKSAPDAWEDGLDGEVIDNEDDTIMSDEDPPIDDNFEEDKITKDSTCDSSKVAEDGLFSELEDDPDSFLAEEELPILSADDDANFDTETLSWNSIRNLLPHKCRPPIHIREDWNKFFSNHLYSTLLPSVLDTCLSTDPNGTPARTSRSNLIAAMSLRTSTHQRLRRPMRLAIPVASGDDREWRDPFSPDDRLLYLPGNRLASDISHLAVRLLRRFLAEAPALMRGWITRLSVPAGIPEDTNTNTTPVLTAKPDSGELLSPLCGQRCGRLRQLASVVDKLVSRHFSPGLARDEVLLVQYKAQLRELKRGEDGGRSGKSKWFGMFTGGPTEIGTITIRGRPLSRENGSILDGIDLWQKNVRKKFEGVEECAICYSVVHNSNFSLPKMQCHTCHKLFHYACMYRWFTTSRNPVCPLCRHRFFGPTGRPIT
ncbi:E3 ubiquitin-protein ligase listerin [Fasciola gigantica]|uniref:E3 ubiquitin-protein ligase listerin n=1 Tax=Fasciola gigantica TaxID=46835 RepID=A0A504Y6N7_FASGI|nr:E3 ubiquitin-protein ligase listerin [Fasciola gigantica]